MIHVLRERLLKFERAATGKFDPAQEFVNTRESGYLDESVKVYPDETIYDPAENAESWDPMTESIETNKVQYNPLKSKESDRVAYKTQNNVFLLQNSTRLDN